MSFIIFCCLFFIPMNMRFPSSAAEICELIIELGDGFTAASLFAAFSILYFSMSLVNILVVRFHDHIDKLLDKIDVDLDILFCVLWIVVYHFLIVYLCLYETGVWGGFDNGEVGDLPARAFQVSFLCAFSLILIEIIAVYGMYVLNDCLGRSKDFYDWQRWLIGLGLLVLFCSPLIIMLILAAVYHFHFSAVAGRLVGWQIIMYAAILSAITVANAIVLIVTRNEGGIITAYGIFHGVCMLAMVVVTLTVTSIYCTSVADGSISIKSRRDFEGFFIQENGNWIYEANIEWIEDVSFVLDADIDCEGRSYQISPLKYDFDGNGHTISYFISDSVLFGAYANVSNLTIKDAAFVSDGSIATLKYSNYGTIENCYVIDTIVHVEYTGSYDCSAGGIAVYNYGTIKNCHLTDTFVFAENKGNGACYAGGIAAYNTSYTFRGTTYHAIISDCTFRNTATREGFPYSVFAKGKEGYADLITAGGWLNDQFLSEPSGTVENITAEGTAFFETVES